MIQICDAIVSEFQEKQIRMTLRQLYYQIVARDLFPDDRFWRWIEARRKWIRDPRGTKNAEPNYRWLGGLVSDARLAGLLDWDAIEDRARQPRSAAEFDSLRDLVDAAVASFRLPRWRGQNTYVELWMEKDSLASVVEPIARKWPVVLMLNRGYSSQSAMYEAAQRFQQVSGVLDRVIFYVGDHDPSGEDMVRDLRDRMAMFCVSVDVQKLALTMAQVREYDPPPNPTKMTDSRAAWYVEKYGEKCWEAEALPPDALIQIVDQAIADSVDQRKMKAIIAEEERGKRALLTATKRIWKIERT